MLQLTYIYYIPYFQHKSKLALNTYPCYNTGMRDYEFYYTQDGSVGLYSYADNDVYHSKFGALSEAWDKFVLPSGIKEKLNTVSDIKILDVCYGIGYNTKALMTYIINSDQKYLSEKNILKKFFKIFKKKKNKKSLKKNKNIETKHVNNTSYFNTELLVNNETIEDEIISHIQIDCLDINSELVKISPLLKTIITPQEMFSRIVPRIFDCFDTYWKIKKFLAKHFTMPSTKDRINISELLDLKFGDNYKFVDKEYKIHDFVNYILVNNLTKHYSNNYINDDLKKLLKDKRIRKYFNKNMIKYAKFKQSFRYKFMDKLNLFAFLHNIYYDHLSKRYKKASLSSANNLFSINFYVDDARKSILNITEHYDYIFLDAFTYSKAPELWTVEFMAELYNRLSPTGYLMTYSNSALVRNTLLENNFYLGKILDSDGKSIGTIATKDKGLIEHPLSNYELGLCSTKAGIPYHDPNLNKSREDILRYREYDFKTSDLMTSSQYLKQRTNTKNNEENNGEI